jgi:type I restriction enzyme S subunit
MPWDGEQISLEDENRFETLNGLWTGKKPPFVTASVIRNTNFTESGRVDYSDVARLEVEQKQLAKRQLKSGDIIVERSGGGPKKPVGRVVYFDRDDGPFSFSNFTTAIRVRDTAAFDSKFIFYGLLELYQSGRTEDIQRRTTGIRNLDFTAYKERATFPRISIVEQRKITGVLGLLQKAMEQQERLLALTAELKNSLVHQLFTHGLCHETQKQTEIGPIPKSWEVRYFSDLVKITNGQVDPSESPYREMLHVGPENIEAKTGRLLILSTNRDLGIKSGNYLFTPEDILYSKIRPYLRKAAQPDFQGTCSADMYPLRPIDNRLNKGFLFHLLLSEPFNKQSISFQDRTGIPKINRQQLGRVQIPVPPLPEQKDIATSLDAIDVKFALHRRKHAAVRALFRTLLHELMTARIRVHNLDLSVIESSTSD